MAPRIREDNGGERDGRFANSPYQMVVRRVGGMGSPPPRGQRGERDGRFANKPLPDGCQTGRRDGSPPPVFTGAGSRREDNGGSGTDGSRTAPTRWLSDGSQGWVPASAGTTGGSGTGGSRTSPYQMVVRRVVGMGPRIREDNGGRISTRGQRGERDGRFANKPLPDGCQTGGRDGSLCSVHPPHF